jgi:phenylalanyl-tRNA synthetase beta chain
MKISYNWLLELIQTELSPAQIADLLTGCGLEVDGIESYQNIPGALEGIVVGEVITCEKHPNADRLRVTTVNIGQPELLHIVCGAANVAVGQKVLVATPGSKVYPINGEPFEIKKSKIRGEVSEGMICAEDELSLGHSHDGILVLPNDCIPGSQASDYFPVYTDTKIEIGLTANRGDAASHLGVARDLKALLNSEIKLPGADFSIPVSTDINAVRVNVQDIVGCKRYTGITLKGVTVSESPSWLKNKLKVIGLNPVNVIVDITNYVMHECGQPLHAFDMSKISGGEIVVKTATPDTLFTTLDKTERKLNGTECMICDTEKPLAIAGVFGGLHSGITSDTKDIFIESAWFDAASVRKTAKLHGLSTDASFRFERGTDPELPRVALKRAVQLVLELAGGSVAGQVIDVYPMPAAPVQLDFRISKLYKLIGQPIDVNVIKQILTSLDFVVNQTENADVLHLVVPLYRTEVTREADVAEEILRIFGLNNIDIPQQLKSTLTRSQDELNWVKRNKVADFLSSNGFVEMLSNSLSRSAYYTKDELTNAVKLLNPLSSDLDILRITMLWNGLEMLQYNRNRKLNDIQAFEFGNTYVTLNGKYEEHMQLALYIAGNKIPENWQGSSASSSFYQLKSMVQQVLSKSGIGSEFICVPVEHLHIKPAFSIYVHDIELGTFGVIAPSVASAFDLEYPVYYACLNWQKVNDVAAKNVFSLHMPSPFPAVNRDLALLIDESVTYDQIKQCILSADKLLVKDVSIFDVYRGDKLEAGKKSYAISITLQHTEKTLTDEEVDATVQKIIHYLNKVTGAVLRQ